MEHGGKVGHAEIKIGDSPIMLADQHPEMNALSPKTARRHADEFDDLHRDVDTMFKRAIELGATETRPVQDQFYGDKSGTLTDPLDTAGRSPHTRKI